MEKIQKNESNILFNTSSNFILNKNLQGISYENYLNQNKKNNQSEIKRNITTLHPVKNIPFSLNANSLYFNMLRYNFFNNNYIPYNTNTRINSLLLDFNNELKNEYDKEDKKTNNHSQNITENKINAEYNFTPLIKKLESQEDERFAKSRDRKSVV